MPPVVRLKLIPKPETAHVMRGKQLGHAFLYVTLLIVGFAIGVFVAAYLFWPIVALTAILPLPDGRTQEFASAVTYFIWMLIPFIIAHVFSLTLFKAMTNPADGN